MAMTPEQRRKLSELVGGEVDERGNITWPDGKRSVADQPRVVDMQQPMQSGTGYMRSSSGNEYQFTPQGVFQGGQQIKRSVDTEFVPNYSRNPVDLSEVGIGDKTWRVNGKPNMYMSADGTVYNLTQALSAEQVKADREWEKDQMDMRYRQAQIDELNRRATEQPKLSPTEMKAQQEIDQKAIGQKNVSTILDDLRNTYQKLDEMGATVKPERNMLGNIMARVGSSAIGQGISGFIGTEEQTKRDEIASIRPLLMQAIRKATGMSAREMDANKELEFYLKAATDPSAGYQANLNAISRLNEMYGLGFDQSGSQQPQQQQQAPTTREGTMRKSKSGRMMVYRNGGWEYLQ